jgi:MinD superfamily P-loop ATPase
MTKRSVVVSNQVRCKKCNDTPYSANRHDFKYCKCGAIAVDGGMDYLKRVGDLKACEEMSITITPETKAAIINEAKWGMDNQRNALGIAYAVMRGLRDSGAVISYPEETDESAHDMENALKITARFVGIMGRTIERNDDNAESIAAYDDARAALVALGYKEVIDNQLDPE